MYFTDNSTVEGASSSVDKFLIWRFKSSTKEGTYTSDISNTIDASATSYSDSGLASGKWYKYKVQAIAKSGTNYTSSEQSAASAPKQTSTKTPLAKPTSVIISDTSKTRPTVISIS